MKLLKYLKWLMLISGAAVMILGAFMLFTPFENLMGLALLIALVMLFSGVSQMAVFFHEESKFRPVWTLASGAATMLFGVWMLMGRELAAAANLIPFVFSGWMIATGLMRTIGAEAMRQDRRALWWLVMGLGALETLLGFALMFSPWLPAPMVSCCIALMFLLHGGNNIALFFNLHKLNGRIALRHPPQTCEQP